MLSTILIILGLIVGIAFLPFFLIVLYVVLLGLLYVVAAMWVVMIAIVVLIADKVVYVVSGKRLV